MKKYEDKVIHEINKVCTAEEVILVLLGEADEATVSKVQTVARVLLDENTDNGWGWTGASNTNKLKNLFS